MYYYWGSGHYWRSSELFDAWTVVAAVVAIAMLHGVWRLWRGMRLDSFERSIRTLRQQPDKSTIQFPQRHQPTAQARGFQISLLPLMLVSCGLAMLLAQAQRPDDVSRPATWLLFLCVGAWYGAGAWSHRRGFGPLRNEAFAAIASTTVLSALLWGFYLLVDLYHQEPGYQRLTTSVPILLWWTSAGGALGGLIGAFRASRVYRKTRSADRPADSLDSDADSASVSAPNALRKVRWRSSSAALGLACLASLVVHLAAVPHVYNTVYYRYLWWDRYQTRNWDNALTLTMAPANPVIHWASPLAVNVVDLEVSESLTSDLQIDGPYSGPYNGPSPVGVPQGQQVQSKADSETSSVTSVYVARQRLQAGTQVTPFMLTSRDVRGENMPLDAIVDLDLIIGRYVSRDMAAGETLSQSALLRPGPRPAVAGATDGQAKFVNGADAVENVDLTADINGPAPSIDFEVRAYEDPSTTNYILTTGLLPTATPLGIVGEEEEILISETLEEKSREQPLVPTELNPNLPKISATTAGSSSGSVPVSKTTKDFTKSFAPNDPNVSQLPQQELPDFGLAPDRDFNGVAPQAPTTSEPKTSGPERLTRLDSNPAPVPPVPDDPVRTDSIRLPLPVEPSAERSLFNEKPQGTPDPSPLTLMIVVLDDGRVFRGEFLEKGKKFLRLRINGQEPPLLIDLDKIEEIRSAVGRSGDLDKIEEIIDRSGRRNPGANPPSPPGDSPVINPTPPIPASAKIPGVIPITQTQEEPAPVSARSRFPLNTW